jgi:hypothetical protein
VLAKSARNIARMADTTNGTIRAIGISNRLLVSDAGTFTHPFSVTSAAAVNNSQGI